MVFGVPTLRTSLCTSTSCALATLLMLLPEHLSARQGGADDAHVRFEVASVKPTQLPPQPVQILPPSLRISAISLQGLIAYAYAVPTPRILGGEDWIRTERFEVQATAPQQAVAGLPLPQRLEIMQRMVRSLVEERFALQVSHEQRPLQAYVLRIRDPRRTDVPGLRPPDAECGRRRLEGLAFREPLKAPAPLPEGPLPLARYCNLTFGPKGDLVTLVGNDAAMDELLTTLEVMLGKPVQDETGMRGRFGLEVAVGRSHVPMYGAPSVDANAPDGPSVADAFADQLNLSIRLERRPVPVLVVTHAQRPTPN